MTTTTATDQEAAYAARVAANRAAKQQRIDNRGENLYEKRRQQARRDGDGARQWMRMAYANGRTTIPSRILEEAHAIMEAPKMTDNDTIISLLTEIRDLLRGGTLAAPAAVGEQRFTAEKMTATVNDGKAYWKVRGGMFQKFGVSIWPEVLAAAGFDFDAMNPLAVYDLAGYTAVYITDEEGNPRKVTQLIAPQASQETAVSQPVVAQQPAPEPPAEKGPTEGFFKIGDKVKVSGNTGAVKDGVVYGFGKDNLVSVKVAGQMYRVSPDRLTAVELA